MKKILLPLLLLFNIGAFAQLETTLPFMQRLPQSSYSNPAFLPAYSGSFSVPVLPNVGVSATFSGLNANMIAKSINADGILDLDNLYNKFEGDRLGINLNVNYELFHVRFKIKKWFYGVSLNQRADVSASIAKDIFGFAIKGNSYFDGRPADFSTTKVDAVSYNELGFSMSKKLRKMSVGARIKLLNGTGAVYTEKSTLTLTTPAKITDPIVVRMNSIYRTSGLPFALDSIDGGQPGKQDTAFNTDGMYQLKNLGFALDLGLNYELTSKIKVGAALCDWGYIRWTNQTYAYKQENKEVSYGGISYEQLTNDTVGSSIEDSLLMLIKGDVSRDKFTTILPTRFIFNASYDLTPKNILGIVVQGKSFNGNVIMAYTANYLRKFRNIDLCLNYSIIGKSMVNVGAGFMAKMGPFQFYLLQDNLLGVIQPQKLQTISTRIGFNFVWGEIKNTSGK